MTYRQGGPFPLWTAIRAARPSLRVLPHNGRPQDPQTLKLEWNKLRAAANPAATALALPQEEQQEEQEDHYGSLAC